MADCKLCNAKTKYGFNINMDLVPICTGCVRNIFRQLVEASMDHLLILKEKENVEKEKNKKG